MSVTNTENNCGKTTIDIDSTTNNVNHKNDTPHHNTSDTTNTQKEKEIANK